VKQIYNFPCKNILKQILSGVEENLNINEGGKNKCWVINERDREITRRNAKER
jgi:hypothetical protein